MTFKVEKRVSTEQDGKVIQITVSTKTFSQLKTIKRETGRPIGYIARKAIEYALNT